MANIVSPDEIRETFVLALSAMYQREIPQYATLLELVSEVNFALLESSPALHQKLANAGELACLNVEHHGAIHAGSAAELATLRRLFLVMGMHPVDYYDLALAGIPAHATAFRPLDERALARNPFRIVVSLLRPEFISDDPLRRRVRALVAARNIFSSRCRELLNICDAQQGLTAAQAEMFITEALAIFRWHRRAIVDAKTYEALLRVHYLMADAVCFPGCHIHHLTPRTLDIDRIQALMPEFGITPGAIIEGPPRRSVPILLRQTGFRAQAEHITFTCGREGHHIARYGKIEQRGMALTLKGRALYESLLLKAGVGQDNLGHQLRLGDVFLRFPDSEDALRREKLGYFRYQLTPAGEAYRHAIRPGVDPERYIARGWVIARPVKYEDFLPIRGPLNLHVAPGDELNPRSASQDVFEQALGAPLFSSFALYQEQEDKSKRRCGLL